MSGRSHHTFLKLTHSLWLQFLKSSHHMRRVVKLTHTGQLPPQLYGRLDPVRCVLCAGHTRPHTWRGSPARVSQAMWQAFMGDMAQLAEKHPYTQAPNASQMGHWLLCGLVGAVIGCVQQPASPLHTD